MQVYVTATTVHGLHRQMERTSRCSHILYEEQSYAVKGRALNIPVSLPPYDQSAPAFLLLVSKSAADIN